MAQSLVRVLLARGGNVFGSLRQCFPSKIKSKGESWAEKNLLDGLACLPGSSSRPNFMNRMWTKMVLGLDSRAIAPWIVLHLEGFCAMAKMDEDCRVLNKNGLVVEDALSDTEESCNSHAKFKKSVAFIDATKPKTMSIQKKSTVDFSKVDINLLPTVILVGRPNVGKSALFNRLIRRREALVYNTPDDHVTRDIREGIAKLGDLRFKVLDSAGLEMAATSGSILSRTAEMTGNVLARSQFAIFLIDARDGIQPLDLEVGKWLRKHAPGIRTLLALNKSESLDEQIGFLTAATGEAHTLGFGDPVAISAETGLGMADLYEALCPLLEGYMLQILNGEAAVL